MSSTGKSTNRFVKLLEFLSLLKDFTQTSLDQFSTLKGFWKAIKCLPSLVWFAALVMVISSTHAGIAIRAVGTACCKANSTQMQSDI